MLGCIPFKSGRMQQSQQCRRSESILFRKMARAVTSVDLPFKIQFKVADIRLYKFLVTAAPRSSSIRARNRSRRVMSSSRDDTRETESRSKEWSVKLWFPNESSREYSSVNTRTKYFPSALSRFARIKKRGEEMGWRTISNFRSCKRGKFN